jgi:hypothetical protein
LFLKVGKNPQKVGRNAIFSYKKWAGPHIKPGKAHFLGQKTHFQN